MLLSRLRLEKVRCLTLILSDGSQAELSAASCVLPSQPPGEATAKSSFGSPFRRQIAEHQAKCSVMTHCLGSGGTWGAEDRWRGWYPFPPIPVCFAPVHSVFGQLKSVAMETT